VIQIHTCEQGSESWHKVRAGIPTASEFATILAKGKDGGASLTRTNYLRRLAGEIITGEPGETFRNANMERGQVMEASAREYYAFLKDEEPELVGFITNGPKGCSPDALVGSAGLLEIKTAQPSVLIGWLDRGTLPPEHRAQVQGALWVCEREYVDFIGYWPKMPPLLVRVTRDEDYIRTVADGVEAFNAELCALVDRVRRYGQEEAA
jgi:hypothetical protein